MITCRSFILFILFAIVAVSTAGCAFIAGSDDAADQLGPGHQIRIEYRETLRNQASLRGESLRETDFGASPAVSLQQPTSVFADMFRVYVTDRSPSPRLVIFDRGERTMTVVSEPTPSAIANVRFVDPSAVAVDETNIIYVADPPQGKVFALDLKGTLRLTIGTIGELSFPAALAVDPRRGRLYVADKQSHVVRVYLGRGGVLFELAGSGKDKAMRSPVGVALDRAGNCYTLDSSAKRVFVHDPEGAYVRSFSLKGKTAGGTIKPRGIALDSRGHVYVSDGINNTILIFDRDGAFLQEWGRTGSMMHDDFRNPAGIFIDNQDMIYIADQLNGRIQVYQYVP